MAERGSRDDAIPWALVLEVIASIAAVEEPELFGQVAMEALALAVPFDLGSYNEVDPSSDRAFFCTYPHDAPTGDADVEGFPRLVRQNPILRYQEATGDGSAHRISDFITTRELHRLELYRRIYGPLGIEYQVALSLTMKDPLVIAFALNRRHHDFTDREVTVLNVLRPHLIQAYRNVQALAALRGIDDVLAEVGKGIVVLAKAGTEDRAPPWAQRVMMEHFGAATAGPLPDAVRAWLAEERRQFDDGRPRLHRPLVSVAGERQLVIRFVPGAGDRPDVLVLQGREPARELSELRRLGLTAREAEIMQLITHGEPAATASRQLGMSQGTLNKHLQHIYRKLGVTNRAAAIAAATDAVFSYR